MMRTPSANQRRRSRRNCQPSTPPNQRPRIAFTPKLKYANSSRTASGLFVVSSRKRAPPTTEEKEVKRQRRLQIKSKQVSLVALRHQVVNIWLHGIHLPQFQFGPKETPKIVAFLQATNEKYSNRSAAKSFVYRVIKRYKNADQTPHLDAFRDRRGENRLSPKRNNPEIVTLCDELLSEPKATAPKVVTSLLRHGHRVSKQTVHRIARDLNFRWTKPWYTDLLTPAQKLKRKIFCRNLLRLSDEQLLNRIGGWLFTDEKWFDIVGPGSSKYIKALSQMERRLQNQVQSCVCLGLLHFLLAMLCLCIVQSTFLNLVVLQTKRHKSKKGGVQKRVYFWAGISWWGKTPGVAWTAEDSKVLFRHTKNLCVGTLFEDVDDDGNAVVFRIVQTRAANDGGNVCYVPHFEFPDEIPHEDEWLESTYGEVKEWHSYSRAILAQREDLQPPNGMQDTAKTLEIYAETLYPTLRRFHINQIVEDNASPHNNATIRQSHLDNNAHIVGYTATDEEKEGIKRLVELQCVHYRREQDKKAQLTKQTRELDRLPAWPPNSPDLNLIEVVWSWMVKSIRDSDDGWPNNPQDLKDRVIQAWNNIPLESFRELMRSYRIRLEAIHSVDGSRHPQFA